MENQEQRIERENKEQMDGLEKIGKVLDAYEKKEQNTRSRRELAQKYFSTEKELDYSDDLTAQIYGEGSMGIVSLLSDLQHQIEFGFDAGSAEHYRVILNDIKCILINENREAQKEKEVAKVEIRKHDDEYFVNYYINDKNFGMNVGTKDINEILENVKNGIETLEDNGEICCALCGDEDVVLNGCCENCAEQVSNGLFDFLDEQEKEANQS